MATHSNGHSDTNSASKVRKYDFENWKRPLLNGHVNELNNKPRSILRVPRNGVRKKIVCSNPFVKPKEADVKQNGKKPLNRPEEPQSTTRRGPLSQNLGCIHKDHGCPLIGDVELLSKHLLSCEYEPKYSCVHLNCKLHRTSAKFLVKHVVEAHGTPIHSLDDVDTDISLRLAWKFPKSCQKLQWVAAVFTYKDSPLLLMMDVLQPWVNMWIWDLEDKLGNDSKIKIQFTLVSAVPEIRCDDSWCQQFLPFDPKKPFLSYESGRSYQLKISELFMRYIRYDADPHYFVLRLQLL